MTVRRPPHGHPGGTQNRRGNDRGGRTSVYYLGGVTRRSVTTVRPVCVSGQDRSGTNGRPIRQNSTVDFGIYGPTDPVYRPLAVDDSKDDRWPPLALARPAGRSRDRWFRDFVSLILEPPA